jgi:hypothetical protein
MLSLEAGTFRSFMKDVGGLLDAAPGLALIGSRIVDIPKIGELSCPSAVQGPAQSYIMMFQ